MWTSVRCVVGLCVAMAFVGVSAAARQSSLDTSRTVHLSGRVIDAVSRAPIADAVVALSGPGAHSPRQLSTRDGRFLFIDVAPGTYRLMATAHGYADGGYAQMRASGTIGRLQLLPDSALTEVEILLWPTAEIQGRITDETGEPVVALEVRVLPAFSPEPAAGSPIAAVREVVTTTNDLGEYAAPGLRPGAYIVVTRNTSEDARSLVSRGIVTSLEDVESRSSAADVVRPNDLRWLRPAVFFGAVNDVAPPVVEVGAGERRDGVDLIVPLVPSSAVRGTLVGVPETERATVRLLPAFTSPSLPSIELGRAVVSRSGTFQFSNVAFGRYRLVATATARLGQSAVPFATEMMLNVAEQRVDNVVVPLRQGPVVRGMVTVDVSTPIGTLTEGLQIVIEPAGGEIPGASEQSWETAVVSDRQFTAGPLFPGPYRLRANALPGTVLGWSVTPQGAATGCPLALTGDTTVWLVLTGSGTVAGTLTNRRPGSNPVVILFPADGRAWASAACDETGTRHADVTERGDFSIEGLPPGDYFVVAVDGMDGGTAWRNADTLAALSARSTRLTVAAGQTVSSTIRVLVP